MTTRQWVFLHAQILSMKITPIVRWTLSTCVIFIIAIMAFMSARQKLHDYSSLTDLKVGMSVSELKFLGVPVSESSRELVYLLPDQSNLVIALHDGTVFSAWLELRTPLKIQDPSLRHLTFVQMRMDDAESPTWFYAAAPGEGRIFKVSDQGFIQSITWVKPFIPHGPSRNLQVLLHDFTVQRPAQL